MNNHISGFFNSVYRKQTFKWTDFLVSRFPIQLGFPVSPSNFPHLCCLLPKGTGVLRVLGKEQAILQPPFPGKQSWWAGRLQGESAEL